MVYTAYDPRTKIKETIGTSKYNFDTEETFYVFEITGDDNEQIEVPFYLQEKIKSGIQPKLPYIAMKLAHVINKPHNVDATSREFIAYIDLDVTYIATANIDVVDFGKAIKDELHNKIRTYQATTTGTFFMNIEDERYIDETNGRQMIFHYILTLYCKYHDCC